MRQQIQAPPLYLHSHEMNPKDHRDQFTSALKHSVKVREENPGIHIYCLLINSGRFCSQENLHRLFRGITRENSVTAQSDIRMLPLYALECPGALTVGKRRVDQIVDFGRAGQAGRVP